MKGIISYSDETVDFYAAEEKTVSRYSTGKNQVIGKIYLPESWIGKKVRCLLLEEPDAKE